MTALKKLEIRDATVRDIVFDAAKALKVTVDENHNEFCFNFPSDLGSGYIKGFEFNDGFGVLEIDCLLKKDLQICFDKGVLQPLKFLFNREGEASLKLGEKGDKEKLSRLESAIVSGSLNSSIYLTLKADVSLCLFCININRKEFENKIESFVPELNEDLVQIFRDVNGIQSFLYTSYYSLDIAGFMEEYSESEQEGFMKSVFQEGKAFEIFTSMLQLYLDDLNEPDKRIILRKATVESIEEAVDILKLELENTPTIAKLAKRVGLNQNTLQGGFKQMHKVSINEYMRDHRIQVAKELMETTALNITEITYKIGISSRSYFSKLFKAKFHLTPKDYIDSVRKVDRKTKSA